MINRQEMGMMAGGLSKERLERMCRVMEGHVERGDIPGLVALVSRRGETHVHTLGTRAMGGAEPVRRDTLFRVASLTKPVAAVAAMILVEECRIRLDDPVDDLLPELADRRVMKRHDGPIDDTEPARRSIKVRDLLTLRLGIGHVMDRWGELPIHQAFREINILQGPPHPGTTVPPDEWMRRLGTLPLVHHPGERWLYDLGIDVLGVLIARAAGQPLGEFLRERIFEPLGMKDTAFHVAPDQIHRLATAYAPGPDGGLALYDKPDGEWSRPPAFPSASGGLVSTVDDYLAFGRMMLGGGKSGNVRILSRPAVQVMTTNQLAPGQTAGSEMLIPEHRGWGFGMSVVTGRDDISAVPGRFGWDGGLGTSWYCDPAEELVGVLMTQVAWTSPAGPRVWSDFWTSAYQAIDD
ncbi:MAG TPA: serine hydrolase domain-containing protein [Longimicrobium sp.]|nr:serine hydrolase domain-containing protein [Longimicrobium sp.]